MQSIIISVKNAARLPRTTNHEQAAAAAAMAAAALAAGATAVAAATAAAAATQQDNDIKQAKDVRTYQTISRHTQIHNNRQTIILPRGPAQVRAPPRAYRALGRPGRPWGEEQRQEKRSKEQKGNMRHTQT